MALPIALLALAKGFTGQRTSMIADEQEKLERLQANMEKTYAEGVKLKQGEYDSRKEMWDNIEGLAKNGDYETAARVYWNSSDPNMAKVAEAESDRDGKVGLYDPEKSRSWIDRGLSEFKSLDRPMIDPDEINRIHERKAIDNMSFERSIRSAFGIEESEKYVQTPYKGLRKFHQTQWAKENDPRYRDLSAEDQAKRDSPFNFEKDAISRKDKYTRADGQEVVVYEYAHPENPERILKRLERTTKRGKGISISEKDFAEGRRAFDSYLENLKKSDSDADKDLFEKVNKMVLETRWQGQTRQPGVFEPLFNSILSAHKMAGAQNVVGAAASMATRDIVQLVKTGGLYKDEDGKYKVSTQVWNSYRSALKKKYTMDYPTDVENSYSEQVNLLEEYLDIAEATIPDWT